MDRHLLLELFGYSASLLIATSLMMSSLKRLRIINLCGASCFVTYGLLIHAYPVALLNSMIICINIYHLRRMLRAKEFYQLLEVRPESDFLAHFLKFYGAQIKRILPDFSFQPRAGQVAIFILRDCTPVGVFLAEHKTPERLEVLIDFVIPRYRNLHIGRFLFIEQADIFRRQGIKEIIIHPRTKEFGAYLWEVGFEPTNAKLGTFRIWVAN
ncbi:MAG TPA: YgjV family protein [Verrucomicrobiae bacterium]|nr:YgjV family protein [Verrucomicrobiae bacterium]